MQLRSLLCKLSWFRTGKDWLARRRLDLNFEKQFKNFEQLSRFAGNPTRFTLAWENRQPCLDDNTPSTQFDTHYIYHTAWAARILARLNPAEHTDVSSTLYFCGIMSAFIPIKFYDYRPADLRLDNLVCAEGNLMGLPFLDNSIDSLSCMHVVEHIGLGRYGDPLDPEGDLKAIRELTRVLAPGGSLLFVVPLGIPRVSFNAHRVYSFRQVRDAFLDLELIDFSFILDNPAPGGLIRNPPEEIINSQDFGCGCFWFRKTARMA